MLTGILAAAPARTIDEVIAIMTAIDGALPDGDGLKWFNRLYLRVTVNVRDAVTGAAFNDPAFLAQLDVVFGNLYFDAATAAERNPDAAPPAWRPLFERRNQPHIARIQFALAGMNAHINRDLPAGIVAAFDDEGGTPVADSARRQDFDRVNTILEQVEAAVKAEFESQALQEVDEASGRLDDTLAMWSVSAARAAAWTNAQILWTLRSLPPLREAFFDKLDRLTGFASRGLLIIPGEAVVGAG